MIRELGWWLLAAVLCALVAVAVVSVVPVTAFLMGLLLGGGVGWFIRSWEARLHREQCEEQQRRRDDG